MPFLYTCAGATPLFIAASWENTSLLESLLVGGADVNKVHLICVLFLEFVVYVCAHACLVALARPCMRVRREQAKETERIHAHGMPYAYIITKKRILPGTHSKTLMVRLP